MNINCIITIIIVIVIIIIIIIINCMDAVLQQLLTMRVLTMYVWLIHWTAEGGNLFIASARNLWANGLKLVRTRATLAAHRNGCLNESQHSLMRLDRLNP
jgi:hypothetical protein